MSKPVKYIIVLCVALILLVNVSAYYHAYRFTHFINTNTTKTKTPEALSFPEKIKVLLFGVNIPKPRDTILPYAPYSTITLKDSRGNTLDGWLSPVKNSKGTILLFHGYIGTKSELLETAKIFNTLGYSTFLLDFPGHGASSGYATTIGYHEAEDVKIAYDTIAAFGGKIILYGESMGAAAVMRSLSQYSIDPDAIIIECPFGSLVQSVRNRFRAMGLPTFILPEILVFWGSVQHKAWLFNHVPAWYSERIYCPTLLLYGANDTRVTRGEIDNIYNHLMCEKQLVVFKNTGHESYIKKNAIQWEQAVAGFLKNLEPKKQIYNAPHSR